MPEKHVSWYPWILACELAGGLKFLRHIHERTNDLYIRFALRLWFLHIWHGVLQVSGLCGKLCQATVEAHGLVQII